MRLRSDRSKTAPIGALFLLFYPITEEGHRENVERLKAREAQAREQQIRDGSFGSPAR